MIRYQGRGGWSVALVLTRRRGHRLLIWGPYPRAADARHVEWHHLTGSAAQQITVALVERC